MWGIISIDISKKKVDILNDFMCFILGYKQGVIIKSYKRDKSKIKIKIDLKAWDKLKTSERIKEKEKNASIKF